jgi:hypothetical protein
MFVHHNENMQIV